MATWVASLFTNTIRNQLELTKINEDYEKLLKPKIGKATKDFIDAICVYITNQQLQQCKPKTNTTSKPTIINNTDDLMRSYFEHNSKVDMLAYKPMNNAGKIQGGAGVADMFLDTIAASGVDAGKLAGTIAKSGVDNTGKLAGTIAKSSVDNTDKLAGTIAADSSNPTKLLSTAQNAVSTLDASKIPTDILAATDVSALITSTKAKDVMDFYTTEVISKLHCNTDMHNYIDNHIIKPVFDIASQNIAEVGSQHLIDLAKKTTESHLKKCILLIKGQLDTFGAILNGLSNPPTDNKIPNLIIPQYINLLFELFVYSEYGLIVDMTIGINRDDIKTYITKLKPFNVQIDEYIKDDKYPDSVISLNGLKIPTEWKINDDSGDDKNNLITKDIVIAEFKKLFKPDVDKIKGGSRKSRTKKYKTTGLPVAKHCSRRKRQ